MFEVAVGVLRRRAGSLISLFVLQVHTFGIDLLQNSYSSSFVRDASYHFVDFDNVPVTNVEHDILEAVGRVEPPPPACASSRLSWPWLFVSSCESA